MPRDGRRSHLEIDFSPEPFRSVPRLLLQSARLFLSNLPFLAAITLLIFLPGKLLAQFLGYLADIPTGGVAAYFSLELSDLILGALVTPAVIFGLMEAMAGRPARVGPALGWGRRQFGKSLGNRIQMEITILLWTALLLLPGLLATMQLMFVDPVVAVEADRVGDVLERSRQLTQGHRWRIFFVMIPVWLAELGGTVLTFKLFGTGVESRWLIALADSLFSVAGQWMTVIVLLMYLGVAGSNAKKLPANVERRGLTPTSR